MIVTDTNFKQRYDFKEHYELINGEGECYEYSKGDDYRKYQQDI